VTDKSPAYRLISGRNETQFSIQLYALLLCVTNYLSYFISIGITCSQGISYPEKCIGKYNRCNYKIGIIAHIAPFWATTLKYIAFIFTSSVTMSN
jgi:hypothetical protein